MAALTRCMESFIYSQELTVDDQLSVAEQMADRWHSPSLNWPRSSLWLQVCFTIVLINQLVQIHRFSPWLNRDCRLCYYTSSLWFDYDCRSCNYTSTPWFNHVCRSCNYTSSLWFGHACRSCYYTSSQRFHADSIMHVDRPTTPAQNDSIMLLGSSTTPAQELRLRIDCNIRFVIWQILTTHSIA